MAAILVTRGAQAAFEFEIPVNQPILDGYLVGLTTTVEIRGVPGWIQNLEVTLDISGSFIGDLYAYVMHGKSMAVLLNRPGKSATDSFGYGDHGLKVTFSMLGTKDIHNYGGNDGQPVIGLYQPDGRLETPQLVLDTTPRTATLSSFNGMDPNGEWIFFVADAAGGDLHQLNSLTLTVMTVVPEPGMTGFMAGLFLLGLLAHSWRRAKGGAG